MNITHTIEIQYGTDWISANSDIVMSERGVLCDYGIFTPSRLERIGNIGRLQFDLDNGNRNSAGRSGHYSPGSSNARTGFDVGTPVRWTAQQGMATDALTLPFTLPGEYLRSMTTKHYKFYGKIEKVDIAPDEYGAQISKVTAADWMRDASQTRIASLPAQVDKTIDQVVTGYFSDIDILPNNQAFETGASVFSYAGAAGGSQTALLSELRKLANSEPSYIYMRGDSDGGGTLVVENATSRNTTDLSATLSAGIVDLRAGRDWADVVNDIQTVVHPSAIDTDLQRVYNLEGDVEVPAGKTTIFSGRYRDSDDPNASVAAYDVQTMNSTDYTIVLATDGQGLATNAISSRILSYGTDLVSFWRLNDTNGLSLNDSNYDLVYPGTSTPATDGIAGWNCRINTSTNYNYQAATAIGLASDFETGTALVYFNARGTTQTAGDDIFQFTDILNFDTDQYIFRLRSGSVTGTDYVIVDAFYSATATDFRQWLADGISLGSSDDDWIQFAMTWDMNLGTTDVQDVNIYLNATDAGAVYSQGGTGNSKPTSDLSIYLNAIGRMIDPGDTLSVSMAALFNRVLVASDFAYIDTPSTDFGVEYTEQAGGLSPQFTAVSTLEETAYITETNLYGRLLQDKDPIYSEAKDSDSIATYGISSYTLDMTYQDDSGIARSTGTDLLAKLKDPNTQVDQVSFTARYSSDLINAFLDVEPGDRIAITEEMTGLVADEFWVHGVNYKITSPDQTLVKWIVYPA
jgi:hypothetical protein